jgi:hypothetical protein
MKNISVAARQVVIALTGLALLSSCASEYGGPRFVGWVKVESPGNNRLVYFFTPRDFQAKVAPLVPKGGKVVGDYLATNWSASIANGQVIQHISGNFVMVYICGTQAQSLPVQILSEKIPVHPNVYRADCNA